MTIKRLIVVAVTLLMATTNILAQDTDWEPIGVWPFVYKNFRPATIEFGLFSKKETVTPCNIHVGKNALWFAKDGDTLMEAVPTNIRKVVFQNGDTYMPIGNTENFGKVLYEGELQGKIARVYFMQQVDQRAVDQQYIDFINKTQNMLQGGGGTFFGHLAESAGIEPEERPVPLINKFFFFFNGELFEAKPKDIISHINPDRKKEYRAYTRSAEVISTNQSSIMKLWNDFFVNY